MAVQAIPYETTPGFARSTAPLFLLPGSEGAIINPDLNSPESQLVGFCEALYQAAIQFRDQDLGQLDRWRTNLSWYLHGSSNQGYVNSSTVENMIFEKVEKVTADTVQDSPSFQFLPQERDDVAFCRLMNDAMKNLWNRLYMDTELMDTIKATNICGTWYWKIIHDPRHRINGSVERVTQVPCWSIVPAPYHLSPESSPWIMHIQWRSVGEIWNDYRVAVSPELGTNQVDVRVHELLKQFPYLGYTQTASGPTGHPAGGPMTVPMLPDTFMGDSMRSGLVLQKELYIRDGSTTPKFWWDHANGTSRPPTLKYTRTLRYPKGRAIGWANGRLLFDVNNVYQDGQFPIVKFTDVGIPDFWYGQGEVEPLINLQVLCDDVWAIMKQILAFTASGRLVIDESTGLSEGEIGNLPGEIWWVNQGTSERVKWMQGSQIHPAMFTVMDMIHKGSDMISGSHDVMRGINPSGVTAGKALIALQQMANIRIRNRMREHLKPLNQSARMLASRVQQFWPTAKTIRVLGREHASDDMMIPVQFRDYVLSEEDRKAAYDVIVQPGINPEELKQAEFERAMVLFGMGLLSDEQFIERSGLSNVQQVLAELPVVRALRAAAQAGPPSPASQRSVQ